MPLTSLLWLAIFAICLVGSFANPMYGLVVYLLEYYQRPGLHWWGAWLPDLRWNFIAGLVFGVTYLMRRPSPHGGNSPTHVGLYLLLGLGSYMLVVNLWAIAPADSWKLTTHFWKLIAFYFMMAGVITTRRQLDLFLIINMVGAAWWGFDAIGARRVQSRLEGVGAYDTLNSNLLAAHLLTIIPAILIFLVAEKDKRLRLLAFLCLPFVLNLFILANSRGATVGLGLALIAGLVFVRFGQRSRAVVGVLCAGLALYLLADPQFVERQATTAKADDASAESRRKLWSGTLQMVGDYPFGAGGRGFHVLSPLYAPEAMTDESSGGRSSHNSYLQTAAEWGIPGLTLWLAFLASAIITLHGIRRRCRAPDWFYYRSLALELGLIGTLVSAFFSVRFYGESIYWLAAAVHSLHRIEQSALTEVAPMSSERAAVQARVVVPPSPGARSVPASGHARLL